MNPNRQRAITFMELLIALVLFAMVVVGIGNIETFCKHVFTSSDRKAKVINEAGYVMEHMSKFIGRAVGDAVQTPVALNGVGGCDRSLEVWVDPLTGASANGIRDAGDHEIMYCFHDATNTVEYATDFTAAPGNRETLSRNILDFVPSVVRNSVDITLTGCWNASVTTGNKACGSIDNPRIVLQTSINMPSVSIDPTP